MDFVSYKHRHRIDTLSCVVLHGSKNEVQTRSYLEVPRTPLEFYTTCVLLAGSLDMRERLASLEERRRKNIGSVLHRELVESFLCHEVPARRRLVDTKTLGTEEERKEIHPRTRRPLHTRSDASVALSLSLY